MTKKNWLIVFYLVVMVIVSKAQSSTSQRVGPIEVFPNSLLLSPYVETKSHLIQVNFPASVGSQKLNYLSNFILTGGLRLRYKWLNFQIGSKLPTHWFYSQFGKTSNFSIGVSVVKRKYLLQTRYETYNGFYLQNTEEWLANYRMKNASFYQRPDLKAQSLFTVYNYILNHKKYSNPAAVFQFERQIKPAIGFAIGVNHMYNRIESDSGLVPTSINSLGFKNTGNFLIANTIGFQFGVLGTLPLLEKKKLFLTLSFIPGFSLQIDRTTKKINSIIPRQIFSGITNEIRVGIGYNSQKWFSAIHFNSFGNTIKVQNAESYIVQNAYFRVSAGVRLGK